MRKFLILTAALGFATAAAAQQPAPKDVEVRISIGPALQQRAADYGPREFKELGDDLREEVQNALAHTRAARPVRIDLTIEDAVPNRPTSEQLGRNPGLSMRSIGVGGARVSGVVIYDDGSKRMFREQFYETSLRDELGATTWYDAGRAFQQVANDIRRGKLPSEYSGPGPNGNGLFGDRYDH